MNERLAFDEWGVRETRVKNKLHRYVSDTIRSVKEKGDDYDSIDLLIDILYATVISELRDYFEEEYERSYSEGLDGRLTTEPDDVAVYNAIYAEIEGKTFEDRVREYMDTLYADLVLDGDNAAGKVQNSLDLLTESDGHRVRADARQVAGEELSSVGYTVEKRWKTMLDKDVRDTHTGLEGKIVPIDGWFETVNGRAKYPGGFGVAEEDCRCRCVLEIIATLE